MADNSNNRKKALIISVLAFLFAGGGIFLFFIVQGSNDITGAGKKNTFSYGFAVRDAVLPLFKRMGITNFEEEVVRPRKVEEQASGEEVAAPPADVSDWMAQAPSAASPSPSGRPAAPTRVPKMAGRSKSPVGGASAGGSKSAGGVTRFGPGSAAGMTSVSGKGLAGSQGITEKGTLAALKNSRALLGEGLRSNSAMTASNKWNQSFGVGSAGSGSGGGSLAYNKTGLVNLDKIKSGEISNLKFDKAGSLKTTEVSSPVKDSEGTSKALSADKKLKEDVEAEIKKKAAAGALEGLEDAATKPKTEKGDSPEAQDPPESGTCDLSAGPPTALCSAALGDSNTMDSDTKVDWKEAGEGTDGAKRYEVTYSGTGPGITDQYKGQPVNYGDTAVMEVDSKGNVTIVEWKTPVETPVPVLR
ncbi:MAG: hypothetical protein CVU79_00705 [Elusimicrobia bacterium HGW-Elusimicrobia-3]|nr:MAG: hypothetical protein CVU79_00705 [Elusimicrobia bacterium HGW-Elusimicrobia-3]